MASVQHGALATNYNEGKMPIIELVLPGAERTEVIPVAEQYRITVERADGIACTDIEANTAMSMLCIELLSTKANRRKPKPRKPANPSP